MTMTMGEENERVASYKPLTKTWLNWHLNLGLPASRVLRNIFLLFKSLSIWYLVMEPEQSKMLASAVVGAFFPLCINTVSTQTETSLPSTWTSEGDT